MRKFIAILSAFAIIMMMSFPVKAAEQSYGVAIPDLTFSGTTATCSLDVLAGNVTDSIVATVILKRGNSIVKQWQNLTDVGDLYFSDTASVVHGYTYTLHVTLSINEVTYNVADITKTCP